MAYSSYLTLPGLGLERAHFGPLVTALVACVGADLGFRPVQQAVAFDDVIDVRWRAAHDVHQTGMNVHADVGLVRAVARIRSADQRCALSFALRARHPEVPLVPLLRLVHLRVVLAGLVLRRTGRGDQRGIHHRARLQQQALALQQVIDRGRDLIGQLVLLQQVPKAQDRRLVRQAPAQRQSREFSNQRHLVQRLCHRRITPGEPLLHEVYAQHGQHVERRAAGLALRGVRRYQVGPQYEPLPLSQELPLARALRA